MTPDRIIISAKDMVLSYCAANHIPTGGRGYLWSKVVIWGRKVKYDDPIDLAKMIIDNFYQPISFVEVENIQRKYINLVYGGIQLCG